MKSNSFIATLSGAVLAAFLAMALATASAQDSLIRELSFFGTSATRSEVALPGSVSQQLGRGDCSTVVQRYSATESQLIVHIGKRPQSCDFEDLQFLLDGKYYPLDGIDPKLTHTASGNYEWPANAIGSTMLSFKIGVRLAKNGLTAAIGPYGVFESLCFIISENCLTSPTIQDADVGRTAQSVPASSAAASASNPKADVANVPMKRFTAQRVRSQGEGYVPQILNERCDFYYPNINTPWIQEFNKSAAGMSKTFIWFGSCLSGFLHGEGKLKIAQVRENVFMSSNEEHSFDSIVFRNGDQYGNVRMDMASRAYVT